ncbi:Fc receptor-like protein 5 isoform X2 [Pygocentrus nattereri]|uniref:Fc receptor-like protein 5 isoform X2 n=1 Tax=Pygocentrus nattereri TaxID=42514 RepID=UPI0018913B38|nr:Fc receptor-like protein 5 isoform X2 [Pygocentrus nattereri]
MEFRSLSVILLLTVLIHSGQTERPKPAVSIQPDDQVFIGETVTLRCDIQGGGVSNWQYSWFKAGSSTAVSNEQQYNISSVTASDGGTYTCRGTKRGTSRYSHTSDAVTLTVSDLPKPTLTVEPERPVFSGESVTLKCEIKDYDGWTYQWYKQDKQSGWTAVSQSDYHTVDGDTLTIRGDTVINGDQYLCRGERHDRPTSEYSNSVTLTVEALPPAELTVEPKQSPVFSGESVTLKCKIKGYDGWTYRWYKHDKQSELTAVSQSEHHTVNGDTLTIRADTVINGEQYWCRGERRDRPTSSQYSSSVTLTVNALPTAKLTEPRWSPVFTGESVTLKCEIQSHSNWRYQWYKGSSGTAVSQSQTNTFTIRSAADQDQDQYWCRGERDDRPSSSQLSNTVTLRVKERPKAVVSIQPGDQVFIGETVTLTCDIQGGGVSKWQYSWFKDDPNRRVSNEQQYSISSVTESHRGKYTCRGTERGTSRYSHTSDAVTLTVSERPKPAVSIQPDDQVFSGETVTLTCDIQGGGVSNWQYSWFKAGSSTAVSYKQQYSISSVTASDGGTYTCRGTERGTSRYSHTSDAATLTVSGKPTPTVKVDPQSSVYTGDTVTLTCEVESTGWEFLWYKDSQQLQPQSPADKETNTVRVTVSDEGTAEFKCAARRKNYFYDGSYQHYDGYDYDYSKKRNVYYNVYNTHRSAPVVITVTARPKATVTIHPADPVFIGETVTLTCDIGSGHHWQYDWVKNSKPLSEAQQRKEYTISKVAASHRGVYTCKGRQSTQPRYSETSDAVTLTVPAEKPKPELTSSHKGAALIGNPVVLSCKLDQSAGWRFYWSKHTQSPENETKTETHSYTISSVSVSDGGQYWCRAGRGTPVYYTHYSDALWINVTGTTRSVSLTVSPSRAQHFSAGSLSLSCEGQSDSTGWRVRRYTHSEKVSDCSSGLGSVTGSTCNISSLSTSHTGVYGCESESGESSNPVNITVTNGSVILDSPVHPVTEGDPLTLRCLYRDPKPSNLTAEFYKNGSLLQTQTTGEMTIRTVSKSDEGLYHCKHPERGESPQSWISVRGSISVILAVSVVLSLVLILIIILGLFWCYKKKKGDQQNTNQTPDQSQSPGSTQLQMDSGPEPGDVTYAQIDLKDKKKPKKTQDKLLEDDSAAGSGDLTYAQVKTKKKKSRGKATPSDEVTYSQIAMKSLKQDSKGKNVSLLS